MINEDYLLSLLYRYADELVSISVAIRTSHDRNLDAGRGATFSDFEGEIAYCLIRDRKPQVVYEISPDCGYSTLYLYEAICWNGVGKLFSFELEQKKLGRPTDEVIADTCRTNLDDRFFELVIGDASYMSSKYADPDFGLIDSCHDEWSSFFRLRSFG